VRPFKPAGSPSGQNTRGGSPPALSGSAQNRATGPALVSGVELPVEPLRGEYPHLDVLQAITALAPSLGRRPLADSDGGSHPDTTRRPLIGRCMYRIAADLGERSRIARGESQLSRRPSESQDDCPSHPGAGVPRQRLRHSESFERMPRGWGG
jgi:hypothetical protein